MNIFLKTDRPFAELVDHLGGLFASRLTYTCGEEGNRCVFSCLGIEFTAFDRHGLLNDCGIPFESYQIEIDLLRLDSGLSRSVHEDLVRAVGNFLAASISLRFHCEARLVHNLQTSVALYVDGALSV